MNPTKYRLFMLGKTQRWLMGEVRKRGFPNLSETYFSRVVRGAEVSATPQAIMKVVDQVLTETEAKKGSDHGDQAG